MRPWPSLGRSSLPRLLKEPERLPGPLSPYGARKGDGGGKVMGGGFVGIDVSKDRLDVTFTPFARHLVAHYLAIKLINRSNRHAYKRPSAYLRFHPDGDY
jgi:hypothetical protein